jgi:hypothetical protein
MTMERSSLLRQVIWQVKGSGWLKFKRQFCVYPRERRSIPRDARRPANLRLQLLPIFIYLLRDVEYSDDVGNSVEDGCLREVRP